MATRRTICLSSIEDNMTKEKLRWLINYWKTSADRSEAVASKVSGEGEAAEIYRDTQVALQELLDSLTHR